MNPIRRAALKMPALARRAAHAALAATLALTLVPAAALAAIAPAGTEVEINATNFPDEIFRQYISENFDTDSSGTLSAEEAEAVDTINVNSLGITSLTGIEHFTKLDKLLCSYNPGLTEADLGSNTALTFVALVSNGLTSLDIYTCPKITSLGVGGNQLTSLNVTSQTALTSLSCGNNQLTSLDLTYNPSLSYLDCQNNQLTSLNLQNNRSLKTLYCNDNQLVCLEIPPNNNQNGGVLDIFSASDNVREVQLDENGQVDLTTLDSNFDLSRAVTFLGGVLSGTKVTPNANSTTISYFYNIGYYQCEVTYVNFKLSIVSEDDDADEEELLSQSITLSPAKKTLKAKKLKKKKQKFTVKVKGAKTALKAVCISKNIKIKVNSKKKLTIKVKKGTAKGTYRVRIYAKSNKTYENSSTKTLYIYVK